MRLARSQPARLIMTVFFVQGMILGTWFPRIPDVQARLDLSPGELALGLIGMPVGSFLALLLAGRLVEALTPHRTMMIGVVLCCLLFTAPGWAWDIPSLFVSLIVIGASYVTIDVAMNVEAAAIEQGLGRRIMVATHGFWSLGSMFGGLLGGAIAEVGIATRWHLLATGLIALPVVLACIRALPAPDALAAPTARPPVFSLPGPALIGLAMFAFGVVLAELATRNWAAVFLREVVGASPAATGVAYGAFALCMAAGRFLGDRAADRFGSVAVARACVAGAVLGTLLVVTANTTVMATLGLAIMGLGISVGYPLAVTAAAGRGDQPATINVAALALVAFSSALVGPPLVGFVADFVGLRVGMATLLPFVVASLLLAGQLDRRQRTPRPMPPFKPRA